MAALPLWWVSPHAVKCPLLPSSALPQPRAVLLHVVSTWAGLAPRCDAFPLLLEWLQPQQRQQMFVTPPSLPAHSTHGHCGCAGCLAHTHFSPGGVDSAAALGNGHPNTFPLSPLDSPLATRRFLRGKSLHLFFKPPLVAAGLPAH